jgi:hypothetical protein
MYPNPVKQILTIRMDDVQNASIEVLNMEGQVIYSGELMTEQSQIDFSKFASGIYLVRVRGNNLNHTERITKH